MKLFLTAVIGLFGWLAWLPGYGQMGMMQKGGMMNMSTLRHAYVRQHGIDAAYATKKNPLPRSARNLADGKKLYEQTCAVCHGPTGLGDGDAGKGLNPPPANIAALVRMPMTSDGYLYWTISEGGVPLKSAMPPFKGALKEDAIWKIILYTRSL